MLRTIAVLSVMLVCVASQATACNNCGCANCQNEAIIFSVGRKATFVSPFPAIIPMDYVWTNKGGHFDKWTNRFKAPVSGRYSFSYGAGSLSGYQASLALYVGSPESPERHVGFSFDYGTAFNGAHGKTVLELKAGDTVSLKVNGNSRLAYRLYAFDPPTTYFSGYLMHKDE